MKNVFTVIAALFLCSCAHHEMPNKFRGIASLQNRSELEGIWFLQGSNDARGPYNGELELRMASDGTYTATRVVNYISFYYEGLRVQEVWVGKALPGEAGIVITFSLNPSQSVNEFYKLGSKDNLEAVFQNQNATTYKEWITTRTSLDDKYLPAIASNFHSVNLDILRVANRFIDDESLREAHAQRGRLTNENSEAY